MQCSYEIVLKNELCSVPKGTGKRKHTVSHFLELMQFNAREY